MVRRRMRRPIVICLCLALVVAGCGGKSASKNTQPNLGAKGTDTQAAQGLGFPQVATKNTTRVGGADPVANAAAVAQVSGRKTTDIKGANPFAVARAIDAFLAATHGKSSDRVIVASADNAPFAMPAAGYAAKSGDPVLFATKDTLPPETRTALKAHQQPKIYVLGPTSVIGAKVENQLRKLGKVTRIEGPDPVQNAIAFARFSDGGFGWGVVDPGHGLVFTSQAADPQTAAAAAPLSGSGTYGPLLLVGGADDIDKPLDDYLLDIQPGYAKDPVRGVYNHGWIVGDETAVSIAAQSKIDRLLEISPVITKTQSR
jgi:hypothetical protein